MAFLTGWLKVYVGISTSLWERGYATLRTFEKCLNRGKALEEK